MASRLGRAVGLCLVFFLLAGCFAAAPDEMYTLPKRAGEYLALDSKIQETMRALGAEYAAPLSGSNTQTVQLQDLDGDGIRESAIAFFRVTAAEKPLKIYIFRKVDEEQYEVSAVIEGDGTAINSISYENLGGTVGKELVVSWQMSANVHVLVAYRLADGGEVMELVRTGFARFKLLDIDRDGYKEILTLQLAAPDEGGNRAELYDYEGEAMALRSIAPMSQNVVELRTIRTGALQGGVPALFVPSVFGDGRENLVDIFAMRDGQLTNITYDQELGYSISTVRSYTAVLGQDINSDGIMEIPMPEMLPEFNKQSGASDYWAIHWQQFDLEGGAHPLLTTYHNVSDGWYFILPEEWTGQLSVIRRDLSTTGERRVTFLRWNGEETEPMPFLMIYMLIGTNRAARASIGNRQILFEDSSTIYAFEFVENEWDCGLDVAALRSRFRLIRTEWAVE